MVNVKMNSRAKGGGRNSGILCWQSVGKKKQRKKKQC